MSGAGNAVQRAGLHAGLHALSQPLTVVGLALAWAQAAPSEAERALAMEAAIEQCQRAMESVRHLRSMLDSGLDTQPFTCDKPAVHRSEIKQAFGGVA